MPLAIKVEKATDKIVGNQRSAALVEGTVEDFGDHWRYTLNDAQTDEFYLKQRDADGALSVTFD
jgi:hypothetical protein